ncbi:MAG: organomercurial lyase [Candidatus Methylomirabilia bacterium]
MAEQVRQIASTLSMPPDAATSFINKVSERDGQGHVVGIGGLSQKNHPHRFEVDGRALATWCAWDCLFLPALLKQTAKVESSCPATQQKVRLAITPEKVERCEPPTALVSIVVPKGAKKGRESVEEIWMTFCHFVHFFTSPEAAAEWFSGKNQDPLLLSVDEGYQLGRIAFARLLEYG